MLREQPNREQTSFQWREQMMASLCLWGNSYSFLDWDSRGHLRAIWGLRPDWVMVYRNENNRLVYQYQPLAYFSIPVPSGLYEDWQILHIPGLGFDGSIGYSPIAMARQAIGLGLAAEEFAGRFHANNAKPNVVLKASAPVTDPQQLRNAWHDAYGSLHNTGKVAVLPPGLDIATFSINPKDAQFLEGREWQLGEIARIFGVPLQMLADVLGKTSTYASAEQFDLSFAKHTIRPWCTRIEQKINITVLGSQDSLTCKHDMSELERGDSATQSETITGYVRGGIMTPNEGRARLDLNPSTEEQADKLIVQQQMVPLNAAGSHLAPPSPQQEA
jgi:HK97 family phage portal protein